ncbi:FBD-like domain family protein [Arabidopsis thaliana]|uniref:FBD-like domain family protein n=1 Tax=Arabidopsis thaliana TaxID=3702 RepID=F4IFY6_ARATH|nr:FBD-like domain family protein [Arabidopsis thaliana]AEC08887.1 FBD-like domain family protein [Arabidopsis thaliana]|eukprot:NP_973594.1 FBD-like domain family protein [Arabidopsis thaliana]
MGLHCVSNQGVFIDRNEVKVLEIYGYRGRDRELRQVTCFLREMRFLQVMKVEIDADDDNKKQQLINHLLALPIRSSKFQIQFFSTFNWFIWSYETDVCIVHKCLEESVG